MAAKSPLAREMEAAVERADRISSLVQLKLRRLRNKSSPTKSRRPRVVDLFSGCGGLFLGFHRAGATSIGGVEIDPIAARSYARNFHGVGDLEELELHATAVDITARTSDPDALLRRWGYDKYGEVVDLIVGGPPCPAFARVGRAKLREVNEHPEAFRHDPRAKLYLPYLRFVEELAPVAILMENVPDILNHGGHNLGEEICEALDAFGYASAYTLLNVANYGVPQMRERFLLLAIHSAVGVVPSFPAGTHAVEFPPGYEGSRRVALKHINQERLFPARSHFVKTPQLVPGAKSPVSAREALGDLPELTAHLEGLDKRGARRFDRGVAYRDDVEPSPYAEGLRKWPGFETTGAIYDHVTRSLSDRDYRLFRRMKAGDDYPKAYALAEKLLDKKLKAMGRHAPRAGSEAWLALRSNYVPPYDPGKFPNKWRKMEPDYPARTLMAHLGKDTYSHIHYDHAQARTISVREAARLQSFPDGFAFCGTMNPAFRQIGNSVPPLFSYALANHINRLLGITAAEPTSTCMRRAPGGDLDDVPGAA